MNKSFTHITLVIAESGKNYDVFELPFVKTRDTKLQMGAIQIIRNPYFDPPYDIVFSKTAVS